MIQFGGTLLMVGIGSFLLPLFGYQFKLVTAMGGGFQAGVICSSIGLILLGYGHYSHAKKASKSKVKISDKSLLNTLDAKLPEDFFLKTMILNITGIANDQCTLNCVENLYRQIYKRDLSESGFNTLIDSIESWSKSFADSFQDTAESFSSDSKILLFRSLYVVAYGDGNITEKEKNFLFGVARKLGIDNNKAVENIEYLNDEIMAA